MFRKALNLSYYRVYVNCRSANRPLSSQITRTINNEDLVKSEEQKPFVNKTDSQERGLTERERSELAQVIRNPVEMDSFWERRLEEKPIPRKSWVGPDGGISADFYGALHRKYDISVQGFKRVLKKWIELREIYNQRYINRRHAILGPELATAHFVVYRGGRVRFRHAPTLWFTECNQFPNVYDRKYRLISVDASNVKLRYEALDNLCLLNALEELDLSQNKHLDDFMCDKIARLFRNSKTLSVLDLSDNPLISHRGVETLHRIRSLKRLKITGTKAAKYPFIELLIILFNDVNPDCQVIV